MTDVDAIRFLASERDLEFVDLDTYGVDPSAGEILPADVARAHHMVAIKRKFGTPVIATCDPDDVSGHESVRALIGREFISVVASKEQISDWLDRLFSVDVDPEPSGGEARESITEVGAEPEGLGTSGGLLEAAIEDLTIAEPQHELDPEVTDEPVAEVTHDDHESTLDTLPDAQDEPAELTVEEPETSQPAEAEQESETVAEPESDDARTAPTRASKRRSKKSSRKEDATPEPDIESALAETETVESDAVFESSALEGVDDSTTAAQVGATSGPGGEVSALDGYTSPNAAHDGWEPPPERMATDTLIGEVSNADTTATGTPLEPATSLLPTFGSEGAPFTHVDAGEGTDGRVDFAQGVHEEGGWSDAVGGDAADLVAEAVASFQEQRWDGNFGTDSDEASSSSPPYPPLAKALLDGERVTVEDMQEVLEEHDRSGQSIARILTAKKLVTEADLMWGMAQEMGLEFVDLDTVGIDFAMAGSIPEATARHHSVMVIGSENGTPIVAASNPTDVFAMDDLRTIMGRNFIVVVATRSQISSFIGRVFNSGDAADMAAEASLGFDGETSDESVDDIQAITEDAPIVRYVNLLILQALNERASDIHVEPTGSELRIRYRIDGVLHDVSTGPRTIAPAVITRLKVMADLNVAEHRIPQDGRISLNVGSKGIDLRIATLPTIHGEKVVMRVLDKSSVIMGFGDLGFDDDLQGIFEGIYTKPYGTILVTGPTGSGKSTTLYTTLTALNSPEKNIITVEDPVELQLKGVNQVQLNVRAGLTFASALKSILRSDPDIVLVGEIRDKETALIAIEAALTGHLVLATLHTNDAASTPMRLIEMGLEPFLVTSSLSGVLAQRLARRLCAHCKEAYEPTEADIAAAGWTPEEIQQAGGMHKVYRSVGCSACSNTGYRGRKALAELMPITEEIERMIIEGGSVDDIHRLAVSQGMMTLRQSGLRKAIEGETTLEEVLRVVA
jgi:type IV pilus assembly protein PilB